MSYSPNGPGWGEHPYGQQPEVRSRSGLLWALGALVVVLLVALAGLIGYVVATNNGDPSAETAVATSSETSPTRSSAATTSLTGSSANASTGIECDPEEIADEAGIARRNVNVDRCLGDWALAHVYVPPGEPAGDTQYIVHRSGGSWSRYTSIPSTICKQDAIDDGMPEALAVNLSECQSQSSPEGDLGLSTPMSRPSCDGRGIVVLYSAVTPGAYAQEVGAALSQYPGSRYLRTDMACPSLRARDENGNVIYAVYQPSGYSQAQLCADVRAAGAPAYGRWLDTTSNPSQLVTC